MDVLRKIRDLRNYSRLFCKSMVGVMEMTQVVPNGTESFVAGSFSTEVTPANGSDRSPESSSQGLTALENPEPGYPVSGPDPGWLSLLLNHSQLAIALLQIETEPTSPELSQRLILATQSFQKLVGHRVTAASFCTELLNHLSPGEQAGLRRRFRYHVLNAMLQTRYGSPGKEGAGQWVDERLLEESLVITLKDDPEGCSRALELRLRCYSPDLVQNWLHIPSLQPEMAIALDHCWPDGPTPPQVMAQILAADSPLNQLLADLSPTHYVARGYVLMEGMDVTAREMTNTLTHLLLNRESVLEPSKFGRAHRLIKRLFRADEGLILSAEHDQAKLFMGLDQAEWSVYPYSVQALQGSTCFRATELGAVLNIPDLSQDCPTACEQDLVARGVRSLLIIPLVIKATPLGQNSRRLLGLVGVTHRQPYAFTQADCDLATRLIPALTAAMHHTVQDRFTKIHPSVRWRFEQEAERRSWGLPPEPVVFEAVYPLYGISDIRGSSEERNRAIQADLQTQFRLALAVMDAVCASTDQAFAQQFRADLVEHITALEQEGIRVDAEVTLLHYLQETLEANFAYFAGCSEVAQAAVAAYQAALDPNQRCVYGARAVYDQTINQINTLLRDTWNRCQKAMQGITRHYCDVEATDGIDHMIYAGQAIDAQFTAFHLRSLRYEQLRAMCDCARVARTLKDSCQIHLEVTHLVLVQATTVDITHDENTERLFDVRGTRDTRYEIVKKRIDKACDAATGARITQPGSLTIVYSTDEEWQEYRQYLRYLHREGWIEATQEQGNVEPLQGVNGLKFTRVKISEESGPYQ